MLGWGEEIDCFCVRGAAFVFLSVLFLVLMYIHFQNGKVMVISIGCCCRYNSSTPQSPNCLNSCNMWGKMGGGRWVRVSWSMTEAMVMKDECGMCKQNLGRRLVLHGALTL